MMFWLEFIDSGLWTFAAFFINFAILTSWNLRSVNWKWMSVERLEFPSFIFFSAIHTIITLLWCYSPMPCFTTAWTPKLFALVERRKFESYIQCVKSLLCKCAAWIAGWWAYSDFGVPISLLEKEKLKEIIVDCLARFVFSEYVVATNKKAYELYLCMWCIIASW